MAQFFVSCPPGFESALLEELKEFWFEMIDLDGLPTRAAFPECETLTGGLSFQAEEHLGYQINFFSKLAGRVLLRLGHFESRYYDQFEKNLSQLAFDKYLLPGPVRFKVEHSKSRLNNEKNLSEAGANALRKKGFVFAADAEHGVFIRIEKDRVMVSLDTSGEHLHRRGYALHRGEAPLRETLAAYLVRQLARQVVFNQDLTVVDPFAGSGTILFEALSKFLPNLGRDYAWLKYKNKPKLFKSDTWKKNYRWLPLKNFPQGRGFDIDQKSVQNFENNRQEFLRIYSNAEIDLEVRQQDSEHLNLQQESLRKNVWVVCNPPYGIRLADENAREILEKIEDGVQGMVVVHPVKWRFHFKNLVPVLVEDFNNQGLHLKLSVFSRKIHLS